MLSDRDIKDAVSRGRIGLDPYVPEHVQPASVDISVANEFRVFGGHSVPIVDPREDQASMTELVTLENDGRFVLHPNEFALGATVERIRLADDIVGRLEGKSSLGRLGLLIHSTAGFIDPGFEGHLTLELANVAKLPIAIYPGMLIGQISFVELSSPAQRPYGSAGTGSKYQGQRGPTPSRFYRGFL